MSKIATFVLGLVAIALGIAFESQNVAFMVGLAFAIAASANFPVLVASIFWGKMTTRGAFIGGFAGLITAVVLTILSKAVWGDVLGNTIMGADGKAVPVGLICTRQPGDHLDPGGLRLHLAVLDHGQVQAGQGGAGAVRGPEGPLRDRYRGRGYGQPLISRPRDPCGPGARAVSVHTEGPGSHCDPGPFSLGCCPGSVVFSQSPWGKPRRER